MAYVASVQGAPQKPSTAARPSTSFFSARRMSGTKRVATFGSKPFSFRTSSAVRMAAKDLRRRAGPDVPLYFVGFSTGAALSVEYSLARLEGEDLPRPDGLLLLSPAIGVDPLAAAAVKCRFDLGSDRPLEFLAYSESREDIPKWQVCGSFR